MTVDKEDSRWIIVGRFGRPHGIKGFVTVISFTEPRDNILQYTSWHAFIGRQWQPIKRLTEEVNVKSIVTKIEGYPDRESVAHLTNIDIAIDSSELPVLKEGEYYWHELVGMQVINTQKILLGNVDEVMSTGSNDVLVVVGEKRYLIPYLPGRNVMDINTSQRIITVDWDVDF